MWLLESMTAAEPCLPRRMEKQEGEAKEDYLQRKSLCQQGTLLAADFTEEEKLCEVQTDG